MRDRVAAGPTAHGDLCPLRLAHCRGRSAPLSGVVEALRLVTRECFGVDLRPTPLAEGESWAPTGAVPAPMKLTVAREGENGAGDEELGTIYVDVGLRQGKAPGSAHYALRCGRQLAPSQVAEGGAAYQLPRVLLSLSVPVANATGSVWLTPQAIGTVFHEFGHALHSVLSRTQFQHFSGTRCAVRWAAPLVCVSARLSFCLLAALSKPPYCYLSASFTRSRSVVPV